MTNEAWAEEANVPLEGAGSWTIKDPSVDRGAEPDECYVVGSLRGVRAPDSAIEVVWTRGGIDAAPSQTEAVKMLREAMRRSRKRRARSSRR